MNNNEPLPSTGISRGTFSGGAALVLATGGMMAGEPESSTKTVPTDKSQYHLFNPTPRKLWRELSPDRPDATESPRTVDAGACVIEASYFDWRHDDDRGDSYTVMATNFKVGLTNDLDFQVVFDSYTSENPEKGEGAKGFSDVQLRLKHNVWGNDGDGSAFAVFPFISIPSGTGLSSGEVEGGLILPFGTNLTDGIGLGLMAEIDAVHDGQSDGHEIEFLHSAVLGFDLADHVGTFAEYIGIAGPDPYQAYFAGGITLEIDDDLVFDCGTRLGLNEHAEDVGVFGGFTKRF